MRQNPSGTSGSKALLEVMQVKWLVTAAGALAMILVASLLVWNVINAPHPLANITTGIAPPTVER